MASRHIKLLGVMFNKNLTWKNPITLIENKTSKSLGILRRVKVFAKPGKMFIFLLYTVT